MEALLRRFDVDSSLISGRLGTAIAAASINDVTTASFDIAMPTVAVSLAQRLNAVLRANDPTITQAEVATRVSALIPTEILRGGKLDLNRALGNGEDDDGDGVVDNETADEDTAQRGGPTLTTAYLASARQQLAQDIYITILLACGDRAPKDSTPTPPVIPPALPPTPADQFVVTNPTEMFSSIAGAGGEDRAGSSPDVPAMPLTCLLYTSPSPRDQRGSRMPSSA